MEIKTLKDLKEWISKAEKKFGTDNANLNLFAVDSYGTPGIKTKIYKNEISFNRDFNAINMKIYLNSYEKNEATKITIRKY